MNLIKNGSVLMAVLSVGVASKVFADELTLSLDSGTGLLEPNKADQYLYIRLSDALTHTYSGTNVVLGASFYLEVHSTSPGANPVITGVALQDDLTVNSPLPGSPFTTSNTRMSTVGGVYALETQDSSVLLSSIYGASPFRFARVTLSTVGVQRNAQWDLRLYDASNGADPSFLNIVDPTDALNAVPVNMSVTSIQLTMVPEPEIWAGLAGVGLLLVGFVVRCRRS